MATRDLTEYELTFIRHCHKLDLNEGEGVAFYISFKELEESVQKQIIDLLDIVDDSEQLSMILFENVLDREQLLKFNKEAQRWWHGKRYDSIQFFTDEYDYAIVEQHGKFGVVNSSGDELIPIIYDSIWDYDNNIAVAQLNGKWGAVKINGEIVVQFNYNKHCVWLYDNSRVDVDAGTIVVVDDKQFRIIYGNKQFSYLLDDLDLIDVESYSGDLALYIQYLRCKTKEGKKVVFVLDILNEKYYIDYCEWDCYILSNKCLMLDNYACKLDGSRILDISLKSSRYNGKDGYTFTLGDENKTIIKMDCDFNVIE